MRRCEALRRKWLSLLACLYVSGGDYGCSLGR